MWEIDKTHQWDESTSGCAKYERIFWMDIAEWEETLTSEEGKTKDDTKDLSLKCDPRNIERATVYCHCVSSRQKSEDTNKLWNEVKWVN